MFQRTIKRAIDAAVSATLLLVCLPLLVCVAIAIRWRMGRPVLFRQWRPGLGERPFLLYKFRTMNDACGPDGRPLPDAARLTALGRFIRRTSLDELPQLWNVLRGEMSLVGPRPLRMDYLPYFTRLERLRHSVRPGITGWAQVHGRNEASWDDRFANDVWYVEHWSLWLDLRILWLTLRQVVHGRGIVVDACSIMKNLDEERRAMFSEGSTP
ncbi:MAG: sugar transferase [Thermoguttaceae bacterium]